MKSQLTKSQQKCLLAIADNDITTLDELASASCLDRQEAQDMMIMLDDMGLLYLTHSSMSLNAYGREAMREIKAAIEQQHNEDELRK